MLKFFSTWLSAELTWFLSQKVPAAPLVRLWCVAVSFQSWITCWVRQLENKLAPTAEETFLIQKSDLNPPKPWISTVRVLKVHQIFTKISHSHSCFLHNSCGDRTRFVNSLTRINHLSVKRREKGKANYFGTNFKPMDICASFSPSLCSFYHLISNRTNNNMNKCYVLRAGDTHTCNSQREEVYLGGIKSFSGETDLHACKWSDPSWSVEGGSWNPASPADLPPLTASISVLKSVPENLLLIVVSFCPHRCKSWGSLWWSPSLLSCCFLEGLLLSEDPLDRETPHPSYVVPFAPCTFKEQLSQLVSFVCFLSLDPKCTRLISLGAEDSPRFPLVLLFLLLLRDRRNFTWALLFAWIQWLSRVEDESEESVSVSLHGGLGTWGWKSLLLPLPCSWACSYLWAARLLLLGFCVTGFLPGSCLAGLSTVTGVLCSSEAPDMSCEMADLDKAAGKGWGIGMERKAMGIGKERTAMGNRKRERWKWQHGPKVGKQRSTEGNAVKEKKKKNQTDINYPQTR